MNQTKWVKNNLLNEVAYTEKEHFLGLVQCMNTANKIMDQTE